MTSTKNIQEIMGFLLLIGVISSALLVAIGGTLYLVHAGSQPMPINLQETIFVDHNISPWHFAFSFSALGMIQLGLLSLVATQLLRVALLAGFYLYTRDYWFSIFSLFILFVLIFSIIWRH